MPPLTLYVLSYNILYIRKYHSSYATTIYIHTFMPTASSFLFISILSHISHSPGKLLGTHEKASISYLQYTHMKIIPPTKIAKPVPPPPDNYTPSTTPIHFSHIYIPQQTNQQLYIGRLDTSAQHSYTFAPKNELRISLRLNPTLQ